MFAAKTAALVVGDPLDEATQIGPLATESGRDELAELADRAIVMHEGRVVDQGTLRELLNDADMLHGIGLELSETAEIARVLRQHISDMPTNLLHVDELRDVIVQRYGTTQGGTHVA